MGSKHLNATRMQNHVQFRPSIIESSLHYFTQQFLPILRYIDCASCKGNYQSNDGTTSCSAPQTRLPVSRQYRELPGRYSNPLVLLYIEHLIERLGRRCR